MAAPKFKWGADVYNPYSLESKPIREVRREYSRLRSIAEKRLQRLAASEYGTSITTRSYTGYFKQLKEIGTDSALRHLLSDLQSFLTSPRSTVSGRRQADKKTIETLHERGYEWIDKSNLKEFLDFMSHFREQKLASIIDSDRVVEFFHRSKESGMSPKQIDRAFRSWLEKEQQKARLQTTVERKDSRYLREELGNDRSSEGV